jgi:hypothetical protein
MMEGYRRYGKCEELGRYEETARSPKYGMAQLSTESKR